MKTLEELRAELKGLVDAMKEVSTKAVDEDGEARDFNTDELKSVDDLHEQIEACKAKIKAAKQLESAQALETEADTEVDDEKKAPGQIKKDLKSSEKIGLVVVGLITAKAGGYGANHNGAMKALDEHGYGQLADEITAGVKGKSMISSDATSGGVLLPENMSSDMIELLYPETTFLQGGPVEIPMPNGTFKQPGGATGASASYRGEAKPIQTSVPKLRAIAMSAKLLGSMVPVSNQLIRWSLPSVRSFIENDMRSIMAVTMDAAAYRGAGTEYTPLGITKIPDVYRVAATAGTPTKPTVTEIEADAAKLELRLENANLPMIGTAWRMSKRTEKYLMNLRDGNGNKIYPEMAQGRWRTYPYASTTQIPTNLGVGTDESEIYLIAFGHVLHGNAMSMQLAISDEASISHNGETISMFQNSMTAIKAEMEHDFDVRYNEAIAVLEEVRWGG